MKKILIFIFALGLLNSCKEDAASKVNDQNLEMAKKRDYMLGEGAPVMTFDEKVHDFGNLREGDVVETLFKFKNTGKSDLIISNAVGSCGCTVPEWPKEPIAPGATGDIKVKFNSNGKPNKQNKSVTLTTNTATGKEVIRITADVTPKSKTS